MNKKQRSERDICTKFITPALAPRVIVRGKTIYRGKAKRADYILYYKPNVPLAVIEAKDNNSAVGDGLQQALEYGDTLRLPFGAFVEW